MTFRKILKFSIATMWLAWFGQVGNCAQASVVIGGTRVIYGANESEVTLKLSNEGQSPALVQSWIDAGNTRGAPSNIKVPFTVVPPIARIDPSKSQTIRIIYTGEQLPVDRESIFWLNMLEIPPKPSKEAEASEVNRIQIAFRSRIKLFFRPENLKGEASDAAQKLSWRLLQINGSPALEVQNPTAFHVSLTELRILSDSHIAFNKDGGMIGPNETHTFPLKGDAATTNSSVIRYTWLNDYGGAITEETSLLIGAKKASR